MGPGPPARLCSLSARPLLLSVAASPLSVAASPRLPPAAPLARSMLMGSLLKYSSIAIFVVASYDMEAAQTFCQDPATPSCNTALNPNAYDPRVAGNLYPAPYMDYFCVIIWLFAGGIVSARGEIIQAEIQAKEREAALLKDLASAGGAPVAVVEGQ